MLQKIEDKLTEVRKFEKENPNLYYDIVLGPEVSVEVIK